MESTLRVYRVTIFGGAWASAGLDIWEERLRRFGGNAVHLGVAQNGQDVVGTFLHEATKLEAGLVAALALGDENFRVEVA